MEKHSIRKIDLVVVNLSLGLLQDFRGVGIRSQFFGVQFTVQGFVVRRSNQKPIEKAAVLTTLKRLPLLPHEDMFRADTPSDFIATPAQSRAETCAESPICGIKFGLNCGQKIPAASV